MYLQSQPTDLSDKESSEALDQVDTTISKPYIECHGSILFFVHQQVMQNFTNVELLPLSEIVRIPPSADLVKTTNEEEEFPSFQDFYSSFLVSCFPFLLYLVYIAWLRSVFLQETQGREKPKLGSFQARSLLRRKASASGQPLRHSCL